MPRRVVWYPAGSPVVSLLSALPGDLEATPLPARGVPRSGPDEGAVALVDLTAGDARAASELASLAPDLPVVALVAPGAAPAPGCYAYLTAPARSGKASTPSKTGFARPSMIAFQSASPWR